MRKLILAATAAVMAIPAAPVLADPPPHAPAHGRRAKEAAYDSRGYYVTPRRLTRADRVWYEDGRYHCRRDNGTTGLLVGAAVGALLGNQLAGSGDKTLGTIIGAAGGGALGKAIDDGDIKCR
jgi:uncharacterized protein YcfJ